MKFSPNGLMKHKILCEVLRNVFFFFCILHPPVSNLHSAERAPSAEFENNNFMQIRHLY